MHIKKDGAYMTTFGGNILLLRKRQKLTQAQLAEQSGVPLATIKRFEEGRVNRPNADAINKISTFFCYTSQQLMGHDFSKGEPEPDYEELQGTEQDLRFFEGQTYNLYYLSEKRNAEMKNGKLAFDALYDKKRGILHGKMDMHHNYECTLEAVGRTLILSGTGVDVRQQIIIALHCPDFGKGKTYKYRGGIGLLTHIDTHKALSAQRICLLSSVMDKKEKSRIIQALMADNTNRMTVQISEDSDFSQWILRVETEDEELVALAK